MLQCKYDRSPSDFSWETIGQNIVNAIGQVLEIEIVILNLSSVALGQEKYFIYQNLADVRGDLLRLTVRSLVELKAISKPTIDSYSANQSNGAVELACLAARIEHSITIPLFYQQEPIASLTLHRRRAQPWQEREIERIEILATQASLIIARVIDCDRASALAHRETTVNRITATIRSSLEPHIMFAAIAKELGQALEVDGCALSLWTKQDRFVHCVGLYNPHEATSDRGDYQQADRSVVPIAENPILQQLLQTKQPVLSEDLERQQDMARSELSWHAKARALLVVPLIVDEEIIGSITLRQSNDSRSWNSLEIELAEAVAAQAAIAISQVLAYERVKTLAQRETTINRITATIRSSLEPQIMFAAIVKELGQALQVDGCTLSLWTKRDRFVRCVGLYNSHETQEIQTSWVKQQATQSLVPISENPILQALLYTKKPVLSEDLERQEDLARYELPWHAKARALLIVPLIFENEIIGSITLRQSEDSRRWNSSEIELAEAVASQAAIAVQQAKLYKTAKQQTVRLQLSEQKVKQLNTYLTESVLKRFLPEEIVNKAAKGELALDLHPEPQRITILFCDLVGFTTLSSQFGTRLLAKLLNEFLEQMSQAVFEHGGTIDKYMGDGLMAIFGAPEPLSRLEQAQRAIATARTMFFYLEQLDNKWQARNHIAGERQRLQMRCGIHQGRALVGMFGGKHRKDYTAIGRVVNIASRLEQTAAPNSIAVSQTVANCLKDLEVHQIESLKLKGISGEFRTFTIAIDNASRK